MSELTIFQGELKNIKGRKKKRNYLICKDFIDGAKPTLPDLQMKWKLAERQLYRIFRQNEEYIYKEVTKNYGKPWRLLELRREYTNAPLREKLTILEQIRKELEGEESPMKQQINLVHVYLPKGE